MIGMTKGLQLRLESVMFCLAMLAASYRRRSDDKDEETIDHVYIMVVYENYD